MLNNLTVENISIEKNGESVIILTLMSGGNPNYIDLIFVKNINLGYLSTVEITIDRRRDVKHEARI